MVKQTDKLIYSEVYGIINSMGTVYINSIPKKLYNLIKENRDKTYSPIYNISIPLSEQNISKKTAAFICMLHYNYWCTSEEEKEQINKIIKYNTEKNREKYFNYEKNFNDNMFKINNVNEIEEKSQLNNNVTTLIEKKEITWIERFFDFIREIFNN